MSINITKTNRVLATLKNAASKKVATKPKPQQFVLPQVLNNDVVILASKNKKQNTVARYCGSPFANRNCSSDGLWM